MQLCHYVLTAADATSSTALEPRQLRNVRLVAVMRCLTCTGEYVEVLAPLLQQAGVQSCLVLLQRYKDVGIMVHEVLQMICSFLAHRRFAEALVEQGGVQLLLQLPR